ncbi:hypothetical protein [uncultured Flavobacterium sp.]|uniref:hypothetical protein n=1 Tax=uncultured Flavobacterium sp. TaxID=165435 RepID=UPI0027E0D05A|nr:hypothetical protein [uncultured Flavobacterium sp.]
MKTIRIVIIGIVIALIAFLIFYKTEKINIGGIWTSKEIVLDGKTLYPVKSDSLMQANAFDIIIDDWTNSLYICNQDTIRANFTIKKDSDNKLRMKLTSSESSLNGNFSLEMDTLSLGPTAYDVYAKLESGETLLYIQRTVYYQSQKPLLPRRGTP